MVTRATLCGRSAIVKRAHLTVDEPPLIARVRRPAASRTSHPFLTSSHQVIASAPHTTVLYRAHLFGAAAHISVVAEHGNGGHLERGAGEQTGLRLDAPLAGLRGRVRIAATTCSQHT